MASSLTDIGPKLDWTRDHQMYDRFKRWKKRVEMVMESTLDEETDKAKCNYLKFWMSEEGPPLIQKWEDTGKLSYKAEGGTAALDHTLENYWKLLEAELKSKANRIISIIELWSKQLRQGSLPLNEWITKVYNMVELCDHKDSKDRIIKDVLMDAPVHKPRTRFLNKMKM